MDCVIDKQCNFVTFIGRLWIKDIYLHVCEKRFRLERDLCRKIHTAQIRLWNADLLLCFGTRAETAHVNTRLTASRQFPTECRLSGRGVLSKAGLKKAGRLLAHRICSSFSFERVFWLGRRHRVFYGEDCEMAAFGDSRIEYVHRQKNQMLVQQRLGYCLGI
jgi:hypothetical protein